MEPELPITLAALLPLLRYRVSSILTHSVKEKLLWKQQNEQAFSCYSCFLAAAEPM